MKFIFFGTEQWAAQFLEYLILHDLKPIAVVTKEDKPMDRGLQLAPSPVKIVALKYDIHVLQPTKCSSEEFIETVKKLEPVLCVLIAYGQILPKELLDIPQMGFINLHPSLLPLYRGPSPFQASILNGDKETGISIMCMDEKMDHGPILSQEHIILNSNETQETLHEKIIEKGCPLLVKTLHSFSEGLLTPHEQDHAKATFTKFLKKETGLIDWTKDAKEIERMIRALNPWPGTWIKWKEKKIKILKGHIPPLAQSLNAQAVGQLSAENEILFIQCGDGQLVIDQLQVEGKKPLTGKEFIHGYLKK